MHAPREERIIPPEEVSYRITPAFDPAMVLAIFSPEHLGQIQDKKQK